MFKLEIDERNRKVIIKINNNVKDQQKAIKKAFFDLGKDLVASANKSILEKPKHGKQYKIGNITHTASAPGEAPANLTGSLRRALDFDVEGGSKMEFGVREAFNNHKGGKGVPYGRALELGYKKRNLEPRPFLIKSIKENERNAQKHFENNLKKNLCEWNKP